MPKCGGRPNAGGEFSFTDRKFDDLLTTASFAIEPADLAALPGACISALTPEGREGDPSMWVSICHLPTGRLFSPGIASRFRAQTIPDEIEKWFLREVFQSFESPHPNEQHNPSGRISRPPHARELLVRHDWRARAIVPDAFPGPTASEQRAKQQAVTAEYEERRRLKDPRERRKALQAQWAKEVRTLTWLRYL